MKTRQEKIEAIYEKIARKDLSFGCRFNIENFDICYEFWHDVFDTKWELLCVYLDESIYWIIDYKVLEAIPYDKELWELNIDHEAIENEYAFDKWWEKIKIIWSPVMIWDVLDFVYENEMTKFENTWISEIKEKIIKLWIWDLRNPIEDQSDECVDFVYDLIS